MTTQMIFPLAIFLLSYVVIGFVLIEMTVWAMKKLDHPISLHRSVMPRPEDLEDLVPKIVDDYASPVALQRGLRDSPPLGADIGRVDPARGSIEPFSQIAF